MRALVFALLLFPSFAWADVVRVDAHANLDAQPPEADARTIAAGLSLAAPFDEVVVGSGHYLERVVVPPSVILRGDEGAVVRIVAPDPTLPAVTLGAMSQLENVVVVGGSPNVAYAWSYSSGEGFIIRDVLLTRSQGVGLRAVPEQAVAGSSLDFRVQRTEIRSPAQDGIEIQIVAAQVRVGFSAEVKNHAGEMLQRRDLEGSIQTVLPVVAVGPSLRWATVVTPLLGHGVQVAANPDGAVGPPVLPGLRGVGGVEVAFGQRSPVGFRLSGEGGFLGPHPHVEGRVDLLVRAMPRRARRGVQDAS